jgi:hypothetical protein
MRQPLLESRLYVQMRQAESEFMKLFSLEMVASGEECISGLMCVSKKESRRKIVQYKIR